MNFVSIAFFVFFAVVMLTQMVLKNRRARHIVLLAASYVFYGWWDWRFCFLMLALTIVAFLTALRLEKQPRSRWTLAVGVGMPLAVLFVFKYLNFFIDTFCGLFGLPSAGALAIILPVGISFYTFQSLSYTIDVWRGKVQIQHDFVRFALYIAFFPQLVAGPIVKAADFLPQLEFILHHFLMIFSSVEPAVPASVALRCCIGDILSIRCPADTVAVPLHELGKMLLVLRHGHALVDVDF